MESRKIKDGTDSLGELCSEDRASQPLTEESISAVLASLLLFLGCMCVVRFSKIIGFRDSEPDSQNFQQRSS